MKITPRRSPAAAWAVTGVLALAASASGQTLSAVQPPGQVVVPSREPGRHLVWGVFNIGCGAGWSPLRYQFLFRVPGSTPITVRSIAFRRFDAPGSPVASGTWPAFNVLLEMWMSHSPKTPALYSMLYAENRGHDHELVVQKRTIQFPAQAPQANNQYPFAYRIPLDVPFVLQPGATGVVEMRLENSTICLNAQNRFFGVDAWLQNVPDRWFRYFGTPCSPVPGDNVLGTGRLGIGNPGMAIMSPQTLSGRGSFARIYGGLSNTSWAGLPLPYSLAPLGAPGCSLYISFDWEWPHIWPRGRGFELAALDLPNDPTLVGRKIYVQGVNFDRLSNPLGLAPSQAAEIVVGPHSDAQGSMLVGPFGDPSLGTGQRIANICPVMLLDPQ